MADPTATSLFHKPIT